MDTPDTAFRGQNTTVGGRLYTAFELGEKNWKLSLVMASARPPLYGGHRGGGFNRSSQH